MPDHEGEDFQRDETYMSQAIRDRAGEQVTSRTLLRRSGTPAIEWTGMMAEEISKEEILAVYPKVAQIMADALGCDVEQVGLDVPLIEGLNAESIDFLDIVFHLERTFKVRIPRGKIVEDARGDLPEEAFEQKGHLTEAGLEHLRKFLSEVPADRFHSPMRVADIPRLFTPETFCKVVVRALRAVPGGASRG